MNNCYRFKDWQRMGLSNTCPAFDLLAEEKRRQDLLNERANISEVLNELSPKIASGRHTGADVQRERALIARYLEIERLLGNNY